MYTVMDFIPALMRGAVVTIQITLMSAILAFFMSFIAGFGRISKSTAIRGVTATYVEIFRGTSLLVQLFWLYFAFPMLFGIELSAMTAGVLALALNYGAYGSEVVRSSIQAIPKEQTEAAIALNMTPRQRMRRVILPQAFIIMLPAFGNLLIELLKGTALVSLITLGDLTFQAKSLLATSNQPGIIFGLLLLFYFVLAYPLTRGVRWVEKKVSAGRS